MLKALELVGFKSFADKIRFEFPRGITAIVGPNGSGKSNVVDAIKWVLGEQSVKSLRGKEMADVIFNGSGSRPPSNSAETTLTLDNHDRRLGIDSEEVHITRRVYRSGESEYLINRHPCRLRDIRELFAGTGIATEAYSVIEQGKVDVLLQSSARDRRMIFEEAAGISRFKAKKVETIRRLERIEQNLLRLSDIVEEVESRLRSVRMQAAKARRYKEHSDKLRDGRTQLGLADWRELSRRRAQAEESLREVTGEIDMLSSQAETLEARALEMEDSLSEIGESLRASEARLADVRERITGKETAIEHEMQRCRDLEVEATRHRRQLSALGVKAGDLRIQLQETEKTVSSAETQYQDFRRTVADDERRLTEIMSELDALQGQNEDLRTIHMEELRSLNRVEKEASAVMERSASASAVAQQNRELLQTLHDERRDLIEKLSGLRLRKQERQIALEALKHVLREAQSALENQQAKQANLLAEINEYRRKQSALAERADLLATWEKQLEGLDQETQKWLSRARENKPGPWQYIRALSAETFQINVEYAPLLEAALGDSAHDLVVKDSEAFLQALASLPESPEGRVVFQFLDRPAGFLLQNSISLEGREGIVGRADRLAEPMRGFEEYVTRILSKYWIVDSLTTARRYLHDTGGLVTFVTLQGEVLHPDGRLALGPKKLSAGIISRRSELREVTQRIADLKTRTEIAEASQREADRVLKDQAEKIRSLTEQSQLLMEDAASHKQQLASAEARLPQLQEQIVAREKTASEADAVHLSLAREAETLQARLTQFQQRLVEMEAELIRRRSRAAETETRRAELDRRTTASKVELAKSEERLENLRAQWRQLQRDQQDRRRVFEESQGQLFHLQSRAEQSTLNVLQAESALAEMYLRKEACANEIAEAVSRREVLRNVRAKLAEDVQQLRAAVRKMEEQQHQYELAVSEINHQRRGIETRLREDYGIELEGVSHPEINLTPEQRAEHEREIEELRRKINHMGNVNLEALDELQELETRHESLSSQLNDLTKAKNSLQNIIYKINADSRRLFEETFELVRGHFQTLFRKLFGGGQADVILEDPEDVLESGIEIVARPPGKEPRSISLLSGGEKTLTCVALLLAVFRNRPSPFCVLDEVDAALDEANIDRFTRVLQEFLFLTQFIVITHSKKTMTCANTLYGVTMQESGISKRVSVRFEDVSENGDFNAAQAEGSSPGNSPEITGETAIPNESSEGDSQTDSGGHNDETQAA